MSAPVILAEQFEDERQQHEADQLGMWVFLGTEIMLFGGIFMSIVVYRVLYGPVLKEASHHLDKWLGGGRPSLQVLLSPGADNEAVVALLEESAELAPEATIVPILTPNGPLFQQKLVVMSAAGPPDIMAVPLFDLQQLAEAGALVPLSGLRAEIDQARAQAGLAPIPAAPSPRRTKMLRVLNVSKLWFPVDCLICWTSVPPFGACGFT